MSNWEINEAERVWEIFPEATFEEDEKGYLIIHTNFNVNEGYNEEESENKRYHV